ncbi:FUSC family protein [Dyella sp. ASV21]|uniref:FUSC family protein n=1 Tax=Dyella sp. ASV21 TaxID=2795114 RepID=UPI0018EDC74E|nr:FUSC family protein [Dyella sp. ASV21]
MPHTHTPWHLLKPALWEAVVTMLAVLLTLGSALLIAPGVQTCVLAVVLSLSLSRSQLDRDLRGRVEAAFVLPVVGLAAVGVGLLLLHVRWIGAAVFVVGMFVSIWLRRFGPMARRAGSLIALPFVVLLTVPHVHATPVGPLPRWLVPIMVALLALLWVSVAHRLLGRLPATTIDEAMAAPSASQPSTMRPVASTRMAIQMAVALAVSFVVGYLCFAERWGWIVLTAFIVNSGNRGRLDVAYKSGLRVLGAAAGTVLALSLSVHAGDHPALTGMLILGALFMGVWLRPFGYAWWALFVTLALALLQGFAGDSPVAMLWQRLEEIVIGAVIGLAAAWWVLPVRSTDVLRRRLADALAALAEALDPNAAPRTPARFVAALAQVELIRPPFRASRWATRRLRATHPADWIDALLACRTPAIALIEQGQTPGRVRQAVGAARKALREPDTLLPALLQLRQTLDH